MPPTSAPPSHTSMEWGVAKLMELVVGGNDIAGYPCPFIAVFSAAFNDLTKSVVEGDAIG
ncbi:Uncharacterised protein [Enterobacter asburiae]|uniref:Uncharacterized protein n=1 Tax=Enterobacter asburiae TaxID=61645 RepID=A0A376F7W3_ENTAS|nr:Uncharacterised protein [Enterobacter asburiae]